jgi:hypothetical protein
MGVNTRTEREETTHEVLRSPGNYHDAMMTGITAKGPKGFRGLKQDGIHVYPQQIFDLS